MKKVLWVATLASFMGMVLAEETARPAEIARVKVMQGEVRLERQGAFQPVMVGMGLLGGDKLHTGTHSSVGITYIDNTLVSAGAKSVVVLDRCRFNSTTHEGSLLLSLVKGSLAVISGKIAKANRDGMQVNIPAATLGIRGTEFFVRTEGSDE